MFSASVPVDHAAISMHAALCVEKKTEEFQAQNQPAGPHKLSAVQTLLQPTGICQYDRTYDRTEVFHKVHYEFGCLTASAWRMEPHRLSGDR